MNNKIFLSYRRGDSPGYVSKLEQDLESAFGKDHVFRDVDDIQGGADWKTVLEENLSNVAALLVIIGPRWEAIWEERRGKESDYIVYELNTARDRGIPIIPVTLNHTRLTRGLSLGPISWLREKQFYDISDKQNRWEADVQGLISLLNECDGLSKDDQSNPTQEVKIPSEKKKGIALPFLILGFALMIGLFTLWKVVSFSDKSRHATTQPIEQATPAQTTPSTKPTTSLQSDAPAGKEASTTNTAEEMNEKMRTQLIGTWLGSKGTVFQISQAKRKLRIESEEFGVGSMKRIERMPNKFTVQFADQARGEYALSNSERKFTGWLEVRQNHKIEKRYEQFLLK